MFSLFNDKYVCNENDFLKFKKSSNFSEMNKKVTKFHFKSGKILLWIGRRRKNFAELLQ